MVLLKLWTLNRNRAHKKYCLKLHKNFIIFGVNIKVLRYSFIVNAILEFISSFRCPSCVFIIINKVLV